MIKTTIFTLFLISLSLFVNGAEFTFCTEASSGLAATQTVVNKLNQALATEGLHFSAQANANFNAAAASLKSGSCNLIEVDAVKAYGLSEDPAIRAKMVAVEGSGNYLTMAVARKSKLVADNIQTFCDIIGRNWRACHTGYFKSAGWISPMIALLQCAESHPQLATACSDLSDTGAACHAAAFGDSCIPAMTNSDKSPMAQDAKQCKQCRRAGGSDGICALPNDYENYFGAAKGVIDGLCDIGFIKVTSMQCADENQGFCVGKSQATCVSGGTCDSDGVYGAGRDYDIGNTTYVRVPGYGMPVPAHLIMAKGMTPAQIDSLMLVLPQIWQEVHATSLIDRSDRTMSSSLGAGFVSGLGKIPFLYSQFGLTAPSPDSGSSNNVTPIVVGAVIGGVFFLLILAYLIVRGPEILAKYKVYKQSGVVGENSSSI